MVHWLLASFSLWPTPNFRDAACQPILGLPARGENARRPDLPGKKPSDPVDTIT
jgi:hypothetical protein